MGEDNKVRFLEHSEISFEDLRMKQSVRTTFKLPEEVIELLSLIAGQLGIKQKSLLDQLIEDSNLLVKLAKEVTHTDRENESRQAKTFVISRSSLESINDVARKQKISRDILVEISINRLRPIVEGELEKHENRKQIFEEMQQLRQQEDVLYESAKTLLGEDDDLFKMIDNQRKLARKNIKTAALIIKKGMPMEEW